jgi:DNA-binding MarR family transcriptional regulator
MTPPAAAPSPLLDADELEQRRQRSIVRLALLFDIVLRKRVLAELATRGHPRMRFAHGVLFRNLDHAGTSLAELARRAGISRQAMHKRAGALAKMGYVTFRSDPTDRRVVLVAPTARGTHFLKSSMDAYDAIERDVAEIIGPRRMETWRALLRDLYAARLFVSTRRATRGPEDEVCIPEVRKASGRKRPR